MAKYKIEIKKSAAKEIRKLPRPDLKRVLSHIESLGDNPRPPGAVKLTGEEKYRLRIGDYRILYSVTDEFLIVWIVKVGHRKDVYR